MLVFVYITWRKTSAELKEAQSLCEGLINPVALSAVRSTITNNAGDGRKDVSRNNFDLIAARAR